MLTLKAPLQLHTVQPLTVNTELFGERIRGNYGLLGAHFAPKDLLFLMTAAPDLPEGLGGMTTLVDQQTHVDIQSITMDVVNNVVNRILLDGTEQFTYQDQVYITTVLDRLGITNVTQFMDQVRRLRVENRSTVHLMKLYRSELERLVERRLAGEAVPTLPLPPREGAEQPPQSESDPRVSMALHILHRLNTARIYETVHAFQRDLLGGDISVSNSEMRLSEQLRVSNELALTEVRQALYQQPRLTLAHHLNIYEAGLGVELPQNEEQVLSQAAAAALLTAVDSTAVEILNRPQYRAEQWVEVKNALWQAAENTVARFESYHTQPSVLLLRETESEQAWHTYARELLEYETLRKTLLQGAEPPQTEQPPAGEYRERTTLVWNRTEESGEAEQPLYKRSVERLLDRVERTERESRTATEALSRAETIRQDILHRSEYERQTHTQALRETIREQMEKETRQTILPERTVLSPQPPQQRETAYPPVSLTPREAEEQAPALLREEIERIDRHNRTILQTVQAQSRQKPPVEAVRPDIRQTMRSALRALEEPEAVLRELREEQTRQVSRIPLELTPQEESLLRHTEPRERALYEAVLSYQRDPETALAGGLLRPADQTALQAALRTAAQEERLPASERAGVERVLHRETAREQAQELLERVTHLTERQRTAVEERTAPPKTVQIVHRQQTPDVTEELIEQLGGRREREIFRTDSTEQVTQRQSRQVDVNQIEHKVVTQTTEDITELINRTLARQMRSISDQVYRQMEKRLQTERSRRGRL